MQQPFLVVGIPLPSCRFASSHLPQGDGFCADGELCGIAIRRPLGGAGALAPEGVYTAPKIVALYGARGALPVKMRLWPRHRLEEVPSLSSFHCPAGRETVQVVSVGL